MTRDASGRTFSHEATFSASFLEPRYPEPAAIPRDARWVIVRENGVYVFPGTPPSILFPADPDTLNMAVKGGLYLGHRGAAAYYAAAAAPGQEIRGGTFHPNLRDLYGIIPDDDLALAAFAVRIVDFDRTTGFCGRCGSRTRHSGQERARVCDACGLVTYPRTSPAIIVLVRRGDSILLARSPRFPPGLHSVIAGFVEPGETIEEAVHREVGEETGIAITNLRYLGSEPWPFPNSLMIGFVADYAGGEIAIDNNEIVSAGWFDRAHLPALPSQMSISRALIDWWIRCTGANRS